MSIVYHTENSVITLQTDHSTYQMQIGPYGHLLHLYYGPHIEGETMSHLIPRGDFGFSPAPAEAGYDRTFSVDVVPQEYSGFGVGDFRTPCLCVVHPDGSRAVDLRVISHHISQGKPCLTGLPAVHCPAEEAQTLEVTLKDTASDLIVVLSYSVLAQWDMITRSCCIVNGGTAPIYLERCFSACLDFPTSNYDWITLDGRHTMERSVTRAPLRSGTQQVESIRGASSHQHNPFVMLCDSHADETKGCCYGMCFVYSGNFAAAAQVDQFGQTRVTMGISPEGFCWKLEAGQTFQAPEVILAFSNEGISGLSHLYHRLIRERVCRGYDPSKRRPVLINSWEAAYFDFNEDKLVKIAKEASQLGVELLVMDDGWFGKRDNDVSGLGDWMVNQNKLPNGLNGLCEKINALGMKLGIWIEPEMVSEDSDLYRAHPDWCLQIPGRPGARGRFQLVLDFSRQEVVDYLYHALYDVLSSANLEYVKWDMNRHLTDVWSPQFPPDRQGEVGHRYVLGVYQLLERLTFAFPNILWEGCSGGGGRFDAGMLYYTPQIWCSDNTDALDRISIQYGTSLCYPISCIGSHVSICPNHQTGRTIPLSTRGLVAMSGTFGYELDPEKLTDTEKAEIQEQIRFFKKHYSLIQQGGYFRLTNPGIADYTAWQFVSPDKSRSLVFFVSLRVRSNWPSPLIKLQGLEESARYYVQFPDGTIENHSGKAMLCAGLRMPVLRGDYPSAVVELEKI